jgi:hypothetical protein
VNTLGKYANSPQGIKTGDDGRFRRNWWELSAFDQRWRPFQGTPEANGFVGGMRYAIDWADEGRDFARLQGSAAWDKYGVVVKLMGDFSFSLYYGELFDSNVTAVVPSKVAMLPAIWSFCLSPDFKEELNILEDGIKVNNATVVKVPFDVTHWEKIAAKKYPMGLPEPESDDPTQWLFHGRPEASTASLQVAVSRLAGYRWPAELDGKIKLSRRARALVKRCDELASYADNDGIICIPSVRGEEPGAERLEAMLAAVGIKPTRVRELTNGVDLDEWLRNGFFEEHCKLFHDRPFVWHIWDGRKRDGFHALVNYHKLCEGKGKGRKLLESLTYAYLGDWITRQKDGVKRGEGGADDRLIAAVELQNRLKLILEGEPPFDLFVRWKSLADQRVGWEPDINDGVRMNIRPFLASDLPGGRIGAGVLRWKPNIKWDKDRGKEPEIPKEEYPWLWNWNEKTIDFTGTGKEPDGNRWNDCHYTIKAKQAARAAGKGKP